MNEQKLFQTLTQKQQELLNRISAITQDFKKGRPQDFAEQTTESENDQVLNEIRHEAELELKLVNIALQRIEDGKYGMCIKCDRAINPERLQALPYASTCINCAT